MASLRKIWILPRSSTKWRHNDVIVTIKLCLDVGNDDYIILCYFGGHVMSGFKVIEGEFML